MGINGFGTKQNFYFGIVLKNCEPEEFEENAQQIARAKNIRMAESLCR